MNTTNRELTYDQYLSTFIDPMTDIIASAEEIVDLWAYAEPILTSLYPDNEDWDWHVKHVYENGDSTFQHILIPVPQDNTYLLIVVDVTLEEIIGHHLLDLGKLYGINQS